MALDLAVTYAGQVDADGAYPQGKARNVVDEGDGTGTPWEEQIVNDWLGFFQSLLDEAGTEPSGDPDEVGTSDYLDSLKAIIHQQIAVGGTYDLAGDIAYMGNGRSIEVGDGIDAVLLDIKAASGITARASSTITVLGALALSGTAQTLTAPIVASGAGRVNKRRVVVSDVAGPTEYDVTDGDIFVVESLSQASEYTLGTTGAVAGSIIEFTTQEATHIATVRSLPMQYTAEGNFHIRFMYDGVDTWEVVAASWLPAA